MCSGISLHSFGAATKLSLRESRTRSNSRDADTDGRCTIIKVSSPQGQAFKVRPPSAKPPITLILGIQRRRRRTYRNKRMSQREGATQNKEPTSEGTNNQDSQELRITS